MVISFVLSGRRAYLLEQDENDMSQVVANDNLENQGPWQ